MQLQTPASSASSASVLPTRARGPEAFRPSAIARYELPGDEVTALNKADWPAVAADAVLLVHDVQNHWLDMFEDPAPWFDRIVRLRRACDAAGVPTVYTTARRARSTAERGLSSSLWGMGIAGAQSQAASAEVVSALTPRAADFVIDKPKYSAFYDTDLDTLLRRLGRRQLLLTGVFGHHGVMLTAADAYMRNVQVLLVADAMADYSRAEHDMTVAYVAEVCGCITTTARLVAELDA